MIRLGKHIQFSFYTPYYLAQCSPRHACPLKGPLLMQVQRWPQAAPRLALVGSAGRENACKTMHLMDAWLNSGKMTGFTGIF
jgi:hypothetical protein